jgi:hypothetical protein
MAVALVESYSAGFLVQIYSQNHEADFIHPIGENENLVKDIFFNNIRL